jgi:hypothetical protein
VPMLQFIDTWLLKKLSGIEKFIEKIFHSAPPAHIIKNEEKKSFITVEYDIYKLQTQGKKPEKSITIEEKQTELATRKDALYFGIADKKIEKSDLKKAYKNLNHLLPVAIASGRSTMLDYVLIHHVNDKIETLSPEFAMSCIWEAFASGRIDFMKKILANQKLKTATMKFKATHHSIWGDEPWHERIEGLYDDRYRHAIHRTMKRIVSEWPMEDINWIYENIFSKFPFEPANSATGPDLYMNLLHRPARERSPLIMYLDLTHSKLINVEQTLYYCIYTPSSVLNLMHDISNHITRWKGKIYYTPDTPWGYEKTKAMNLSIADLAAHRGSLITLRKSLEEWMVPVDIDLLSYNSPQNPGILRLAVNSGDIDVFNYIINYISQNHPQFGWGFVTWDLILDEACFSAVRKNKTDMVAVVIQTMKTKCQLSDQQIAAQFHTCITSGHGAHLITLAYGIEKLNMKSMITTPGPTGNDMMLQSINKIDTDAIKYLIEEAGYDVRSHSEQIVKTLKQLKSPLLCIDRDYDLFAGKSKETPILSILIKHHLIISEKELIELKEICFIRLHEYSSAMPRAKFDAVYGEYFSGLIDQLKNPNTPQMKR